MSRNFVAMAYRITKLPKRRVKKRIVLQAMLNAVENGDGILPKGLGVNWRWLNSKDGEWREAPLKNTVQESRAGFLELMARRINRDLDSLGPRRRKKRKRGLKVRAATEREIEEIEEIEEELEEERRGRQGRKRKAKARKSKARRQAGHKRKRC